MSTTRPPHVNPASRRTADACHDVTFYADRDTLARGIVAYTLDGLDSDESVVLIVAQPTLDVILAAVAATGVALNEAQATGRLVWFDAHDTFTSLDGPGGVDWAVAETLVTQLLADAAVHGRPVRLFGEMVSLLWDQNRVDEAMHLEQMWHRLVPEHHADVLCAYPSATTAIAPTAPVNVMCALHDHVVSIKDGRQHLTIESFPYDTAAVRQARRLVERLLADTATPEKLGDALLIVSELAANAIQHAKTAFTVGIDLAPTLVRLSVHDASNIQPAPRLSNATTRGGRGLALVELLADNWGVTPTADGKQVWATVNLT